jgi:hypothetical protein
MAVTFARERRMSALLLDDDHRLGNHVPMLERQFELFLRAVAIDR